MDPRRPAVHLVHLLLVLALGAGCGDTGAPSAGPAAAPVSAADAEAIARRELAARADARLEPAAALAELELVRVHDLGARGRVVIFRQRHAGTLVYRGDVKVLLRADGSYVTSVGAPLALPLATRLDHLPLGSGAALERVVARRYGAPVAAHALAAARADAGGFTRLDLAPSAAVRLLRPARARLVLVAEAGRLVPAYQLELQARGPGSARTDAYRTLVAADDGRVLEERDLTHGAFRYRVWADAAGDHRPADGPLADYTPHPTGIPDGTMPDVVPSVLLEMDGFNRTHDPWLPNGSQFATGNNADVYTDAHAPDGFSTGDLRLDVSSPGTFDYAYDFAAEALGPPSQARAGLTQAFYTVNWLHDWYYDSGFDEAAGNAQTSNYGRGGVENDALVIQDQDSADTGERDNAFMITPLDGDSPTMSIFVCTGDEDRSLTVSGLGELASAPTDLPASADFDVTAPLALGTPAAACGAGFASGVAGAIAVTTSTGCDLAAVVTAAVNGGAVGLLLAPTTAGDHPESLVGYAGVAASIPVLAIEKQGYDQIVAALAGGSATATMHRRVHVEREGGLDTQTIAHEWGHYLHLRLADCNAAQCSAISEGWGDFNALHLTVREGDDLHGSYALSPYTSATPLYYYDPGYFGFRRTPYSVDFSKNAFTFADISDDTPLPTSAPVSDPGYPHSEVHNAGEIWAEALFEVYVALLERPGKSFAESRRTMSDYVVAGLEMTPADASFTEQRDALLAVAVAASPEDHAIMAAAFARRGLGSCAVSPAPGDEAFAGVKESFELAPRALLGTVDLSIDAANRCDQDDYLDSGEVATLRVPVQNGGAMTMSGAHLHVDADLPGVTFPAGQDVELPELAPYESMVASLKVAMPAEVPAGTTLELDVSASAPGACETKVTTAIRRRAGVDEVAASSASDDVEAETSAWTPTHSQGSAVWTREEVTGDQHEWRGPDPASTSDLALESPDLHVSAREPFVIELDERHAFELSPAMGGQPVTYWDGGVIELSDDAGHTWKDVSSFVAPGYGGTIDATGTNPLGGRKAFVGLSQGYPQMNHVRLDLGTQLAGKTVRLRFRIGSDQAEGGDGWAIDSLAFAGIDGTPFSSLEADPVCGVEPPTGEGDGGCGCRAGGGRGGGGGGGAALVLLLAGAAWVRRRYFARTSMSASVSAARAGATGAGAAAKPSLRTRISYFLPASTLRKRY